MKLILMISLLVHLESNINTGVVKFYNEVQGFGYIIDKQSDDEIFVYGDSLIDEIEEGNKVTYKKRNTRKGWEAFDVKLIK